MVSKLAREVMALNDMVAEIDKLIEDSFCQHDDADVIASLPGIGALLGAEFFSATGVT